MLSQPGMPAFPYTQAPPGPHSSFISSSEGGILAEAFGPPQWRDRAFLPEQRGGIKMKQCRLRQAACEALQWLAFCVEIGLDVESGISVKWFDVACCCGNFG